MTNQEIFDKVLHALRAQRFASVAEDGMSCAYRGVDGRKCAAGHLMEDEHYNADMEGAVVAPFLSGKGSGNPEHALVKSGVPDTREAMELVRWLQHLHDMYLPRSDDDWNIERWEYHMSKCATEHGLVYTPPGKP